MKLFVHNIGAGQVLEDCLFDFKIIGHYRYFYIIHTTCPGIPFKLK
ncbi:MAG: DUF1287 domain-containing protein [Prolixibacteraceae bacterium]